MSHDASPHRVITTDEMNGRIAEIEAQRLSALNRCAIFSGEKALLARALQDAKSEIDRLNGLLDAKAAAGDSSGDETKTAH